MFDIIIGLFGGLFYGANAVVEKLSNAAYDKKYRECAQRRNDLVDKLTDYDLQRKVREFVLSGKNTEDVYAEIRNELLTAFGEEYKKKFPLPTTDKRRVGDHYGSLAVNLIMSREGKLENPGVGVHIGTPGYMGTPGFYDQSIADGEITICRQIEKNLQKFIPELEVGVRASDSQGVIPGTIRRTNIYLVGRHRADISHDWAKLW